MDIIKLLFIIIGAILIVVIGLKIKNNYKKKYNYSLSILEIANILKLEISFNKDNIKIIFEKILNQIENDEIKQIIDKYKITNQFKFNLLNEKENIFISDFFNKLGEYDLENTLNNINKFILEVENIIKKYKEDYQNKGNLAFKLCVCLSLVFMIIFA